MALSRLFNNSATRFACLRVALCRSVPFCAVDPLAPPLFTHLHAMDRRPAALRHAL